MYIWKWLIYGDVLTGFCISLSNEFGTKVVRRRVKTENYLSTFVVVGVVNTEIFITFI